MNKKSDAKNILIEEYSRIKKQQGLPFQVLADKLGLELFDLYKEIRKIDSKFPLQIEEIGFIIENKNKIPRHKIIEKFDLKNYHFTNLTNSIGISFQESEEEFALNSIKWLIEEELKLKINDELPQIISENVLREHGLNKIRNYVYSIQKGNKELYPLPSLFVLIDIVYPNTYKPWQFRGMKKEYWSDKNLGKLRLAEALRWIIEDKKKISHDLIPNLKKHRTFITARELQYYHLYKDAFKYQFNNLDEWIDYTYPENESKRIRENTIQLVGKLNEMNRNINICEICGLDKNIEIHHIIPLWKGGTNDVYNLICVCSNHHTEAHKNNYHEKILINKIVKDKRLEYFKAMFSINT